MTTFIYPTWRSLYLSSCLILWKRFTSSILFSMLIHYCYWKMLTKRYAFISVFKHIKIINFIQQSYTLVDFKWKIVLCDDYRIVMATIVIFVLIICWINNYMHNNVDNHYKLLWIATINFKKEYKHLEWKQILLL